MVARSAGRTLSGAHAADLNTQERYGVSYLRYWVDEADGKIFCLVEAPDAQRQPVSTERRMGSWLTKSSRSPRACDPQRPGGHRRLDAAGSAVSHVEQ